MRAQSSIAENTKKYRIRYKIIYKLVSYASLSLLSYTLSQLILSIPITLLGLLLILPSARELLLA